MSNLQLNSEEQVVENNEQMYRINLFDNDCRGVALRANELHVALSDLVRFQNNEPLETEMMRYYVEELHPECWEHEMTFADLVSHLQHMFEYFIDQIICDYDDQREVSLNEFIERKKAEMKVA